MQDYWDDKYKKADFYYGKEPNEFIRQNKYKIKAGGDVLCLAEGEGRNAVFLAKEGFSVEAIEISGVALSKLTKRIKDENVALMIRQTMIENWKPEKNYDGIVITYLHEDFKRFEALLEKCLGILNLGGIFLLEAFAKEQKAYQEKVDSGGPQDAQKLYSIDELYKLAKSLPCEIEELSLKKTTLNEGIGHVGEAMVIRLALRKL